MNVEGVFGCFGNGYTSNFWNMGLDRGEKEFISFVKGM